MGPRLLDVSFSRSQLLAESSSPVRVAYVVSWFPKITETFVLNEMRAAAKLGVELEIFPLRRSPQGIQHDEAQAFVRRAYFTPFLSWAILAAHVHYLVLRPGLYATTLAKLLWANWGSLRYLLGAIAFFPKAVWFARQMTDLGVEHIHAHFASHPAAVAFVIHRLTGIPYSFTAHGSDLHRDRHMLREKVQAAAFVVTVSHYNREMIIQECGPEARAKVAVIRCGIEPDYFRARQVRGELRPPNDPFCIVCIGMLHEVKGQKYLIDACRRLRDAGYSFVLHLVGDGPDRLALADQARQLGLIDVVTFHGWLLRHQVAELLGQADLAVAPSVPTRDGRREGIPVALMEAMASGVTVVASNLSGIPELVEDDRTGLLVQPRDVQGLCEAFAKLLDDIPLRCRLSAAAREKVVSEFNLERNVEALVGQFRRVLSDRAAAEPSGHASLVITESAP